MNSDYTPPNIVAVFLVKFDTKFGYEILWSKTTKPLDLDGIEYKCLPSGIHEFDEDLTLFTHKLDKMYYGISKFRQINSNQEGESNRDQIKMYTMGCLCEPLESGWVPNNFVSNGFEYITYLDKQLLTFLKDEDTSLLETIDISNIPTNKFANPVDHLPEFFNRFGPLVFKIFKLSLLRKRIIIFNQSKKDNYSLQIFNYLISIISVIPAKLKIDFDHSEADFIQPLYNICLHDLENRDLRTESFVATTNDDILMYQPIYDYAIVLNDELSCPEILSFQDVTNAKKEILKSTYNDYSKFKIIYKQLLNNETEMPVNKSVDNISINTSTSILSNFKLLGGNSEQSLSYEPNWWLHDSTYPLSWTQFIWSAFSWFASAGFNNQHSQADQQTPHLKSADTLELVEIVGYFHKLTKKWLYLVNDIISDELYQGKVVVTFQDLANLELDTYSNYDTEFIKGFIQLYFGVDTAEVSSGLNFFC